MTLHNYPLTSHSALGRLNVCLSVSHKFVAIYPFHFWKMLSLMPHFHLQSQSVQHLKYDNSSGMPFSIHRMEPDFLLIKFVCDGSIH